MSGAVIPLLLKNANPKLDIHSILKIKDTAQWMWHGSAAPAEKVTLWEQLWELWELLAKLRTATEAALTFAFQLFLLCSQGSVSLSPGGARGDHPLSACCSRGEHCTVFQLQFVEKAAPGNTLQS